MLAAAAPLVELALSTAPRLLVLGPHKPVGVQVVHRARERGVEVLTECDGLDPTLVIGCQFEFGLDELRRVQQSVVAPPRFASLVCPLAQDDAAKIAAGYGQRAFNRFGCPVWFMYTPALSHVNQPYFYTPARVADIVLDSSLRMLE